MSVFPWTSHAVHAHVNQIARFLSTVNQSIAPVSRPFTTTRRRANTPAVNVYSDASTVVLTCEVAGIAPEALSVSVIDDTVTIRGTRAQATPETSTDGSPSSHQFERTISLPFAVDSDHAKARLTDGALAITLTRSAAAQPRTLPITAT